MELDLVNRRILEQIERSKPTSIRQLAKLLGMPISTVTNRVRRLREAGYVTVASGRYVLTGKGRGALSRPKRYGEEVGAEVINSMRGALKKEDLSEGDFAKLETLARWLARLGSSAPKDVISSILDRVKDVEDYRRWGKIVADLTRKPNEEVRSLLREFASKYLEELKGALEDPLKKGLVRLEEGQALGIAEGERLRAYWDLLSSLADLIRDELIGLALEVAKGYVSTYKRVKEGRKVTPELLGELGACFHLLSHLSSSPIKGDGTIITELIKLEAELAGLAEGRKGECGVIMLREAPSRAVILGPYELCGEGSKAFRIVTEPIRRLASSLLE